MVKRDNGVLLNDAISLQSGLCLYLLVSAKRRPCLQAVQLTGVPCDKRTPRLITQNSALSAHINIFSKETVVRCSWCTHFENLIVGFYKAISISILSSKLSDTLKSLSAGTKNPKFIIKSVHIKGEHFQNPQFSFPHQSKGLIHYPATKPQLSLTAAFKGCVDPTSDPCSTFV